MNDVRHLRTERLWLDQAVDADCDDLFAIHSDPASWAHYPSLRHTDRSRTPEIVRLSQRGFDEHGLGYWSVRDLPRGPVIGWGGCAVPTPPWPWWNLAFRFSQSVVRRGYASEMARAAIAAAHRLDPDRPVLAYLLEHNEGSRRTTEGLGLQLVWRGADVPNPDPRAVRLVYLDREPDPALLEAIEQHAAG
ncbi:MAG: GNAT family N-acetyltransferase [Actinobacteria bacterium]|uniref:Unannotated protein n=1 Tax=freshwater metagenome TaxID=449393 RepID=A0A6J6S6T4_9ZZZZ|nr:GNAT family N-acetyltransferase [Actinomycetota bacterium]